MMLFALEEESSLRLKSLTSQNSSLLKVIRFQEKAQKQVEQCQSIFPNLKKLEELLLEHRGPLYHKAYQAGVSKSEEYSLASVLGVSESFLQIEEVILLEKGNDQIFQELNVSWVEPAIEKLTYFENSEAFLNQMSLWPELLPRQEVSFDLIEDPKSIDLEFSSEEVQVIQDYAQKRGRLLNRAEWELVAQTWSEHCKHKIFNALIKSQDTKNSLTDSLFKTHIRNPALKIIEDRQDLYLSLFHDNAGVLRLVGSDAQKTDFALAMKMETHNSPSAISPYGGASTGIVGVQRDILGTGKGAMPLCNWDVLCFETPEHQEKRPENALPADLLRLGVIRGIEAGGNQSGIPTLQGSVFFDPSFAVKPLVFAGSIGLIEVENVDKSPALGLDIYCVGGAVGLDGLRGAVMSSRDIRSDDFAASAVQVANPFVQRRLTDFLMEAKKRHLIDVITDNGAGGLASSVGEMATLTGGAEIDLSSLRLKYSQLLSWEKLLSESQERMTLATKNAKELEALAQDFQVEFDYLGKLNESGTFKVSDQNKCLVDLELSFLHDACPQLELETSWTWEAEKEAQNLDRKKLQKIEASANWEKDNWEKDFIQMLNSEHLCSREGILRRFDHEVQGRSLKLPFSGKTQESPADGSFISIDEAEAFCALAHAANPQRKNIHHQVLSSFSECLSHLVLSGGKMELGALIDNFSWPDPVQDSRALWQLLRSCELLSELCFEFNLPLISGKDSMKNNSADFKVLPTLVISALSSVIKPENVPVQYYPKANDLVYVLRPLRETLCDSTWERVLGQSADASVSPFKNESLKDFENDFSTLISEIHQRLQKVEALVDAGLLRGAKDISEGGLVTALFELSLGRNLGISFQESYQWKDVFSEGFAGFVFSIDPHLVEAFEEILPDAERVGVNVNEFSFLFNDEKKRIDLAPFREAYLKKNKEGFWHV